MKEQAKSFMKEIAKMSANKEWRIDTQAILCLEASESHQSVLKLESSAMAH